VVRPGRKDARPALGPLPAGGRLLVSSPAGAWVVQRGGGARRLGDYGEASWSPHGLFVVATRGRQLVALEPGGAPRWTLSRAAPVRRPSWSPGDGYRIAYLSGGGLRVVVGNGTGDHPLDGADGDVRPAWRPGADRHELAYARPGGRIVLADADTARPLRRSAQVIAPTALEWTPGGRRLVAMAPGHVWVLDAALRNRGRTAMPAGTTARAMAVHPGGRRVAVIRAMPGGRSEVVSIPLRGPGRERTLFAGAGTFTDLAWSPDGRWLLVAWREADQWLFIRSDRVRRIDAAKGIRRHFEPGGDGAGSFPRVSGWCCDPGG
jgi:WD40-like Beta Propeller Repeat